MSKSQINVAIGLLFSHGRVLVGWREAKQHQGNKHEFAGGKIEIGETPEDACRREIFEEVGIDIAQWFKWDTVLHDYDDMSVNLHFFYGYVADEQLPDIEAPWQWYEKDELSSLNFPKANDVILQRLMWKKYIKISTCWEDLQSLPSQHLMYYRTDCFEHTVDESDYSKLILNIEFAQHLPIHQQKKLGAVHLKQQQLLQRSQSDAVEGVRYIAACHDEQALIHAEQIGCEAVFLSPVLDTKTHIGKTALGWARFSDLAKQSNLLVFALGGLAPKHLHQVEKAGGYGVAGISHF